MDESKKIYSGVGMDATKGQNTRAAVKSMEDKNLEAIKILRFLYSEELTEDKVARLVYKLLPEQVTKEYSLKELIVYCCDMAIPSLYGAKRLEEREVLKILNKMEIY